MSVCVNLSSRSSTSGRGRPGGRALEASGLAPPLTLELTETMLMRDTRP